MTVYLVFFAFISVMGIAVKNRRAYLIMAGGFLFLILAFRSTSLGSDLRNYEMYYNLWAKHSISDLVLGTRFFSGHTFEMRLESGYVWVNWLCAKMGMNFREFLVLHALVCTISIMLFLKKYCNNVAMAMILIMGFGIFRSMFYLLRLLLALCVVLYSIKYAIRRDAIRFVLLICIAVLFHRSALALLFIYPLSYIKFDFRKSVVLCVIGTGVVAITPLLFNYIILPLLKIAKKDYLYPISPVCDINVMAFVVYLFILLINVSPKARDFRDQKYRVLMGSGVYAFIVEIIAFYQVNIARIAIVFLLPIFFVLVADSVVSFRYHSNRKIFSFALWASSLFMYILGLGSSNMIPYKLFL